MMKSFQELSSRGGLKAYVKFLDKSKESIISDTIFFKGTSDNVQLEMAIQWNKSYHENCLVFLPIIFPRKMEVRI